MPPREQNMGEGHPPRVVYHEVYDVYEDQSTQSDISQSIQRIRRSIVVSRLVARPKPAPMFLVRVVILENHTVDHASFDWAGFRGVA